MADFIMAKKAASPYVATNSKGDKYTLCKHVGKNGTVIYYFSANENPSNAVTELPPGKEVRETKTGLLMLANVK